MNLDSEVVKLLKQEIERVLTWSRSNKPWLITEDFDIDTLWKRIENINETDLNSGLLPYIYTLLDIYIDAKRHDFKVIKSDYSVDDAQKDLESVFLQIDQLENFAKESELITRIKSIWGNG